MPRDEALLFFFKHAGYSYDPKTETPLRGRWRCARKLAEAEREAHARDWSFEWEWDDDDVGRQGRYTSGECVQCGDQDCTREHEVLGCILRTSVDRHAASLWSIVDPSPDYRRVVEAELASEHLAELRASVFEAI